MYIGTCCKKNHNKRPTGLDSHLNTITLRLTCQSRLHIFILKSKPLSETPLTVTPLLLFDAWKTLIH